MSKDMCDCKASAYVTHRLDYKTRNNKSLPLSFTNFLCSAMGIQTDLPPLTPPLLRCIFAYCAANEYDNDNYFTEDSYSDEAVPSTPSLPSRLCCAIAEASPAWAKIVGELRRELDAKALTFTFCESSNQEVDRLQSKIKQRSTTLRSLRIVSEAGNLNELTIDWDAVFASCRLLQRLEIELPLRSTHITSILNAASTHCDDLEALQLPPRDEEYVPRQVRQMINALYSALERWYSNGRKVGLRQLTVQQRFAYEASDETEGESSDSDGGEDDDDEYYGVGRTRSLKMASDTHIPPRGRKVLPQYRVS